jgi:hypothetical protein
MPLSVSNDVSFPKPALTVDPTVARRFAGLQLMRIIGETRSPVKKIQQNRQREIGHLDKPTLRKQSILKKPFQQSKLVEHKRPRLRKPETSDIALSCPNASQVSGHEFTHAVHILLVCHSERPRGTLTLELAQGEGD